MWNRFVSKLGTKLVRTFGLWRRRRRLGDGSALPDLAFMHIPKTAGTTVSEFFRNRIRPDHFFTDIGEFREQYRADSCWPYFLHGHMPWEYCRQFPNELRAFSFLREPKSRLLSAYFFTRSHPGIEGKKEHYIQKMLNSTPNEFFRYCLDSRSPQDRVGNQFDNVYVRFFLGWDQAHRIPVLSASSNWSFDEVVERMLRLDYIGLTESIDSSLNELSRRFQLRPPANFELRRHNARSPSKSESLLNEETDELLDELTRFDRQVYDIARNHFEHAD